MDKRTVLIEQAITLPEVDWKLFLKDIFSKSVIATDSFIINCNLDIEANSLCFFEKVARMRQTYKDKKGSQNNPPYLVCKNIVHPITDLNRCLNWMDRSILNESKGGLILITPSTLINRDTRYFWSHNDLIHMQIRGLVDQMQE